MPWLAKVKAPQTDTIKGAARTRTRKLNVKRLFITELYIKVIANGFKISKVAEPGSERVFISPQAFTTQRSLVGDFSIAEQALKQAVAEVLGKSFIPRSVWAVVHPLEMLEGGLSQVEVRVLRELCIGAGVKKIAVWEGASLSPEQVSKLLRS